jgi:hypothetical protein
MVGQILPNNNEKCYKNFSQKFLRSKQGMRESWEKGEKKGAFQQQKQPRECMLLSLLAIF